jgi:hypothetical protein
VLLQFLNLDLELHLEHFRQLADAFFKLSGVPGFKGANLLRQPFVDGCSIGLRFVSKRAFVSNYHFKSLP